MTILFKFLLVYCSGRHVYGSTALTVCIDNIKSVGENQDENLANFLKELNGRLDSIENYNYVETVLIVSSSVLVLIIVCMLICILKCVLKY